MILNSVNNGETLLILFSEHTKQYILYFEKYYWNTISKQMKNKLCK